MNVTTEIQWQLPLNYYYQGICSKISWDAQVYLRCQHCGREYRLDGAFGNTVEPLDVTCRKCRKSGLSLVRHLETFSYQCSECGYTGEGSTAGFEQLKCASCDSGSIHVLSRRIESPFPDTFDDLLRHKDHPWGISGSEDLERVLEEFNSAFKLPQPGLHAQIYSRFCRRLRLYCSYSKFDALSMKSAEGQILKEYFRESGDLAAGLQCIRISEECARECTDQLNKALAEHNVAMDVYSVLRIFPEILVNQLMGRNQIRLDAVRAAERALASMRATLPQTHPQFNFQVARILHILGDLLQIGEASPQELRQAVRYLTDALNLPNLDPRLRANSSESRATAIMKLTDARPEEVKLAISDLELSANRDDSSRISSERWTALANLGSLYLSSGALPKAVSSYEHAAALVLHDLSKSIGEDELQYKGEGYVFVMEGLARAYAECGRHEEALDAIETLRASTLRLRTMSEQERQQREKSAVTAVWRDFSDRYFGDKPSHAKVQKLNLDSSAGTLQCLHEGFVDAPTCLAIYSAFKNIITCIVALPIRQGGVMGFRKRRRVVKTLQWRIPSEILEVLAQLSNIDSIPLRAQYLERYSKPLSEAFLDPLLQFIKDKGMKRIGICTPGTLSYLPFDCFRPDDYLINSFDIFNLPSLTVGKDLLQRRCPIQGRPRVLLIEYAGHDLPHAQREVQTLRQIWGDSADFVSASMVSKKKILDMLKGDYSVIHFACHANFNMFEPLESSLFIAGTDRPAERIKAKDVSQIHLSQSPVITLSACSSALTAFGQTNDCVGIPGSLLQSGARAIVGARWSVYDDAAANFMIEYHQRLKSAISNPLGSLCQTKRHLCQQTRIDEWGAFGYLGVP